MSDTPKENPETRRGFPYLLGIALVSIGVAILLDQVLKTGWLVMLVFPISGIVLLAEGSKIRKLGLVIAGGILSGLGVGGFFLLSSVIHASVEKRIGLLLLAFAIGWSSITLLSHLALRKIEWWPMIPAGIIFSLGLCFQFSALRLIDFVLYMVTGVGLILLVWGVFWRLFGLIIPGSLMISGGPGVYLAWGTDVAANALSKTGMMIALFALGWGFIILFSRVITAKFLWWPLIPGGIFAVVGWGLYIGGDPNSAASFIANTGSIGLIIFGLYLLLMRKGIQR